MLVVAVPSHGVLYCFIGGKVYRMRRSCSKPSVLGRPCQTGDILRTCSHNDAGYTPPKCLDAFHP